MARIEGILNALFFAIALVFLLINKTGILTIPGVLIAVIAIYISLKGRYLYSSCLGVVTAFGSFLAQSITAFCPYCTLAATAFLIGGLTGLLLLKSNSMVLNLSLLATSAVGLIFLLSNLPQYEQHPIIAQPVVMNENQETDKALLYISPGCKSCTIVDEFIKTDPEGIYWQPVVIPAVLLNQGEELLREKGYQGEIKSAFNSPTRYVPLLEINGQYYRGNQIIIGKIRKEEGS